LSIILGLAALITITAEEREIKATPGDILDEMRTQLGRI
jgi:hypothetical protein